MHVTCRRTAELGLPYNMHSSRYLGGFTKRRQAVEKRQTFRRQRTAQSPANPPPLTRRPSHAEGRDPGPRLPGASAPNPLSRPCAQTSAARDLPGRAGPSDLRPAGRGRGRAGFRSVQGHGPRHSGTSPIRRGTPTATARPAPALGFRLPPGLLNFGGRKSCPERRHEKRRFPKWRLGLAGRGQWPEQGQGRCCANVGLAGLGGSLRAPAPALAPQADAPLSFICLLTAYWVPGTMLDAGCTVGGLVWEYRGTVSTRIP